MGRRVTHKTRLFMGIAGSILLAGCSLHPSKDTDFARRCDSLNDGMPVVDALGALRIDRDSETMERVLADSGDVVVFSVPRGRCSCLFTIAEGRVLKPRSRCESPTYSDVALMSHRSASSIGGCPHTASQQRTHTQASFDQRTCETQRLPR